MQSRRYSTLFMCLIVAVLVSTALSSLAVRRCVPEKKYFDGCNQCFCSEGREACTMKACSVYDPQLGVQVPVPKIEAPADFWEPLEIIEPPKA